MAKWIWSTDPQAMRRMQRPAGKPPFTRAELARIGIAPHKLARVQEELARLYDDPFLSRAELLALAKEIERQLV